MIMALAFFNTSQPRSSVWLFVSFLSSLLTMGSPSSCLLSCKAFTSVEGLKKGQRHYDVMIEGEDPKFCSVLNTGNGSSSGSSESAIYRDSVDETCGFQIKCGKFNRRFLIPFLQCFATPKFALAFLCCASIAQGFVISGLLSVVITTLEKRFHLHSTETGFIASSYDIASCLSVLVITYIGGKGHKPSWIGWGIFIMGIGNLFFSLPHFIAPAYTIGEEQHNLCNSTDTVHSKCTPSNLKSYMAFFVIAQLLNGLGGTTLFTLGVTYLDENVEQVQSSLYHGIYYASSVVGPAFGFLLGGQLLKIYTDIGESVNIEDTSQLWIGAWWLGFLVGGVVIMILAIPILLFPMRLPNTAHLRSNREQEMHQDRVAETMKHSDNAVRFSDLRWSILVLLRNPTFLFITIAASLDTALVIGLTTFGPKYLESMFSLTPSQAAIYFGILAIMAGATGQLLGGVLVTKAKLTVSGILKFCAACAVIAFATSFVFFQSCPDNLFAGATVKYSDAGEDTQLSAYDHTSHCNMACDCNPDTYDPVCGDDGVTYFSPCFAGCNAAVDGQTYSNCSCITSSNLSRATRNKCTDAKCKSFNTFMAIFFFSILATFFAGTPAVQALLRVVPFTQRSFAIGVKFVILRLLGSIPGPLVFGRVLDLACVVWTTECGKPGSCELYNNDNLASHMAALLAIIKGLVTLAYLCAWFTYKPPPKSTFDRLDDLPLDGAITRNAMLLPTARGAGVAVGDVLRSANYGKVSYRTLKEEVADM
uniref:Solute carrier organic anion transporter family member n=1 Tax=Phallusia mammillata TaxID=59560 RepID=A0A6F9DT97_9ASCI|nr:solute carrier organic anion transporter family member 4A1-like [Phallusia mammillata]